MTTSAQKNTADLVQVTVTAHLSENGAPPSGDTIEASLEQCVADAVAGSFDEYPSHLRELARHRAVRIGEAEIRNVGTRAAVTFTFGLPAELFPVNDGGLQLLVSYLAGDVFPSTEALGCTWSDVRVTEVVLPRGIEALAINSFRQDSAHSIRDIRSRFELPDGRPLLAYSLKPRVGLTFAETRRMVLDVLGAGFNIVELDSRNIAPGRTPLARWLELGEEAAGTGRHVTAFSPNFSLPPDQLLDVARSWSGQLRPYGPPVMKIDGGLDGLTGLQAVRRTLSGPSAPIVTCYPVLRNQLASAIGPTTWVELLALSGADVIYPGGRPTFPGERRAVWGREVTNWRAAAQSYDRMTTRGWPMPTIAGGVHPGHLHACYELLGPQVAYFLGGAVALHPTGVRQGAELCMAVLDASIELAERARRSGDAHAADLPTGLLRRIESTKYPRTELNYHSPAHIFGTRHGPKPFYQRERY